MGLRKARSARLGGIGHWAFLLLLLVLGLQYVAGWYMIQVTRNSKETDLAAHLADLGRLGAPHLRNAALSLTDLALDASWSRLDFSEEEDAAAVGPPDPQLYRTGLDEDLTQPFDEWAEHARLARIVLLGDEGRILYDTADRQRLLRTFQFWTIDRFEIEKALNGQAVASPAYSTGDDTHKRYYEPIVEHVGESAAGEVRAILCLVADRTYLAGIEQLVRHLRRRGIILTVLVLLIGLIIYRLIQRQRRIEQRATEADRLAGIGALAAGFAHELRNPLGIMRAFTEDLERSLRDEGTDGRALEACQDIVEEIARMDRLVGQFLSYSRDGEAEAAGGPAPVLAAIESVCNMLRRPLADKRRVELHIDLADTGEQEAAGWFVGLEEGRLKQVLMNLVLNAIEASPDDQPVRLCVAAAARLIEVRVIDRGPGITPADAGRIFEPFYTTRAAGSGLGLAVSRQIVEQAGGRLELESTSADGGTCFVLRLARVEAPAHDARQPSPGVVGIR